VQTKTVDWLLRGVGFGCALVAGSFAIYMHNPPNSAPDLRGAEHLGVFAQLKGKAAGVPQAPPSPARARPPLPDDVDPVTTGSIGDAAATTEPAPARLVLNEFRVLEVEAGMARIRGRDGEWKARRGAVLPGAGRVLDIERQGNRWVVLTTLGVISE
jgi:hypothetical protein